MFSTTPSLAGMLNVEYRAMYQASGIIASEQGLINTDVLIGILLNKQLDRF